MIDAKGFFIESRMVLLILFFSILGCSKNPEKQVNVGIFKDAACTEPFPGTMVLEITKPCSNYSYVDSKGVTTKGSNGNFRCYVDKLIYDKYPFDTDCNPKAKIINKDHAVSASPQACLRAPSHEGDVFERLLNYQFPGQVNCSPK